jgi:hypothetical protein
MDYVIIVNDNGELKTISATDLEGYLGRNVLDDAINELLDARAIAAGEYDPSTNDDEIVVVCTAEQHEMALDAVDEARHS